jgi:Hypothetical protein (DUF2513)
MQRNMDLVRAILMRIEGASGGRASPYFGIEGFPPDQTLHHAHIMMQEGLIEGMDATESVHAETETSASQPSPFPWDRANLVRPSPRTIPVSLTWKGHEFLDLARDPERWNRAKSIIAKVGGASISVWLKVLTDLAVKGIETSAAKSS